MSQAILSLDDFLLLDKTRFKDKQYSLMLESVKIRIEHRGIIGAIIYLSEEDVDKILKLEKQLGIYIFSYRDDKPEILCGYPEKFCDIDKNKMDISDYPDHTIIGTVIFQSHISRVIHGRYSSSGAICDLKTILFEDDIVRF